MRDRLNLTLPRETIVRIDIPRLTTGRQAPSGLALHRPLDSLPSAAAAQLQQPIPPHLAERVNPEKGHVALDLG